MAPGAAAARRSCPAAACAPLRPAAPTLPAAQEGGKEKAEPYFFSPGRGGSSRRGPGPRSPTAAAALRVRLASAGRRGAPAGRLAALLLLLLPPTAGPERGLRRHEYFSPPRLRAAAPAPLASTRRPQSLCRPPAPRSEPAPGVEPFTYQRPGAR